MKYGTVSSVDKPISRLVQGTAGDFDPADPAHCYALLDRAFEHGFNTFDTAHVYGAERETLFGQWVRERGVRDQVVILAKGAHPQDGRRRVTPPDIASDLHETMAHMGVDFIDLYALHRDDPNVPVGPIVEALNQHQRDGKIGAFGGSNWTHARIGQVNAYARAHGLAPFAFSSPNFSLAEQVEEPWADCVSISGPPGAEAREWYAREQLSLFTWSSLAGGFWSDRFHRDNLDQFTSDFNQMCVRCYCYEQNFQRLDRARELAQDKGVTVPQIALAYVLSQPMDVFALVFCANQEQFAANVDALDLSLTPQELEWLDLRVDSPTQRGRCSGT